ncbi:dephospho-CoA kinase [Pseudonocardia phyllosphaerae]|uniref:dephospho-CoA kinase n=1 Tax=Pseudonocardia phyllosphaerae TaxID=3390502 RepID=UPI003977E74F
MLRTGLTGGIGAGKSTVARRLVERGAVLVDSDLIAREVVAAGSAGLAAVVEAFGDGVLTPGGELDRPALARIVFADDTARRTLDGIVHPLVRDRSAELIAAAPDDAVVVQDIPLLVEGGMASSFPLVVVVDADAEERVRRLVGARGMAEEDARARIAAQATDAQRRAAADVLLDNSGDEAGTRARVDALWDERLVPFEENLRRGRPAPPPALHLAEPDDTWTEQAQRLAGRVAAAAGERGREVTHIGSTAVPGLVARDVLDLQLLVGSADDAEAVAGPLAAAGFPADPDAAPGDGTIRVHRNADPGRPAVVVVREQGAAAARAAVELRDRLRTDPELRDAYAARKRAVVTRSGDGADVRSYRECTTTWRAAAIR